MKPVRLFVACLVVSILFFHAIEAGAGRKEVERVDNATAVLKEIMSIPEKAIPPSLLKDAYGVAVIPYVIKAGFILGGRYGRGVLAIRNKKTHWGNPIFIRFAGGSVGFQIGVQATDFILVFKSRKSVDAIRKGKFTLGADASIAAGPVGRHAEAGTDILLKAEIYSYSRSRGLFAGVALEGSSLQIDQKANEAFYNKKNILISHIINDTGLTVPPETTEFINRLTEYTD